jgi:outer membrane protein assembly factor BamB
MRRRITVAVASALLILAGAVPAAGGNDYPAFLAGPRHSSYAKSATTITLANAPSVQSAFSWSPVPKKGSTGTLYGTPITFQGVIYLGAGTGDFYAIDASTGVTIWRKRLGISNCNGFGIVSSAAVARDPVSGRNVVYVGAANHYLYALDPATGATLWRSIVGGTDPHYFNFASPTVANGQVYMGVSTTCELPLGGGVQAFDQHTGVTKGRYYVATLTAGASFGRRGRGG